MKLSRLSKLATLTTAGVVAALAGPALASASIYCVGSPGGVCDVSKIGTGAGLQDALTEADQSPDADVVRIGPGTYTGSFLYSAPSEVDIQGSGAATVIQGTGQDAALKVIASGSASVVSDLTIRMASVPDPQLATGLRIGDGAADNVRVENPGNSSGDGVVLHPGGDLVSSAIHAGAARGIGRSGASHHEVRDVYIAAALGVEALDGTWNLERLEISARRNAVQSNTTTNLRNSLVRVSGVEGTVTTAIEQLGPGALTAENVTIQGGPHLNYGVDAVIQGPGTAAVNVESSIVQGAHTSSFARYAAGGGSANIVVGHSNFAPPDQSQVGAGKGPGVFQQTPNGTNTNLEPRFVDALVTLESPTVDLRLRHDSPLIDKGEPSGAQGWDLAREARVVNGDGPGDAVRDMGAYEYQRRAPTAAIASPAGGAFAVGTPVAFSAQGSSDPDPGDALSYGWSFGDGASGSGDETTHAYEAGGPHTVTLTVSDPTGLTATATSALLVDAPPAPLMPGPSPADTSAPSMSAVSLTRSVFRVDARAAAARLVPRGTRVRFTLSEAARVQFAIRRGLRARGRWVAFGRFERQASAGRNAVRFSGRLRLGGRTRSLPPGRYRLTLVATDSAGNRSAAKRLPFRIET